MRSMDIIRAWKDPEYRLSLSEAEQALLPDHPAGFIELTDAEMGAVAGGYPRQTLTVNGEICCCDSVDLCGTLITDWQCGICA
jgi:mersacidin/lichenicidin family type 2 lantibiotic